LKPRLTGRIHAGRPPARSGAASAQADARPKAPTDATSAASRFTPGVIARRAVLLFAPKQSPSGLEIASLRY